MTHIALALLLAVAAPAAKPVAVVASVRGPAFVVTTEGKREPLKLFAWLPEGARLETGADAAVVIAFASGERQELGASAQATLQARALAAGTGTTVRNLTAVPPLPQVPALTGEAPPRVAAVRIRGPHVAGLYPRPGQTVLPGAAVLRFQPVAGASTYKITVEDDAGERVWAGDATSPQAGIPAGTLHAGARYVWKVQVPGTAAWGVAGFTTLTTAEEDSRKQLQAAIEAAPDAAGLSLLAEVDRQLGLLDEARRELDRALAAAPGDAALVAARAQVEAEIGGADALTGTEARE